MDARKLKSAGTREDRIDLIHQCPPKQTGLIIIDMQRGFLDEGASLTVPKGRTIIPNICSLMECCRRERIPIIFTKFIYSEAVPCLRGEPFGIEHLRRPEGQSTGYGKPSSNCLVDPVESQGPESADIVTDLQPLPGELVVASHLYDKFLDTPLDLVLRARNVTHLIVTGVTTDICVNCTVLAAANRNYRVTVITDGVATINDAIQSACFDIWQRKFARLRTTVQIMAELKPLRNKRS